jgi:hypothetical protein
LHGDALDDLRDEVPLVGEVGYDGHAYAQSENILEGREKVLTDGFTVGVVGSREVGLVLLLETLQQKHLRFPSGFQGIELCFPRKELQSGQVGLCKRLCIRERSSLELGFQM